MSLADVSHMVINQHDNYSISIDDIYQCNDIATSDNTDVTTIIVYTPTCNICYAFYIYIAQSGEWDTISW